MNDSSERDLARAIATVAQSDPLVKLLQQVRMGRMQPTDAGLRAVTESWLGTYQQVIEKGETLNAAALRRLDPGPRLDLLTEAGVLAPDHAGATRLRDAFRKALAARGG